jgi:YD repeat-containing protein
VFRFLRWRDLIVVIVGLAIGSWMNHRYAIQGPSDYQKWLVRPQLSSQSKAPDDDKPGQSGQLPCLFLVPKGSTSERVVSGSVGDCLRLVPDGAKLDVLEVRLDGVFTHIKTDLYVSDVMPLAFTRCVVPLDDCAKRNSIHVPNVYDMFMFGDRRPYTYVNWQFADRQFVHFQRVSPGTSYDDAVFESTSEDRTFSKSRVAWNGWGWDLNFTNGLTLLSPEAYYAERPQQGSVVGIFDEHGREVKLTRESNGNLTKIFSPRGGWLKFDYRRGRLTNAESSLGESAKYSYDGEGRLLDVVYSTGSTLRYSYDSMNRVVEIEGSPSGILAKVQYGATDSIEQIEVDGETYNIRRLVDDVDVIGPAGDVTLVHFAERDGKLAYTVEKAAR